MEKDFDWEIFRQDNYIKEKLVKTEFGVGNYISERGIPQLAQNMINLASGIQRGNNPVYSNLKGQEITILDGPVRVRRGLDDSELERLAIELNRRK